MKRARTRNYDLSRRAGAVGEDPEVVAALERRAELVRLKELAEERVGTLKRQIMVASGHAREHRVFMQQTKWQKLQEDFELAKRSANAYVRQLHVVNERLDSAIRTAHRRVELQDPARIFIEVARDMLPEALFSELWREVSKQLELSPSRHTLGAGEIMSYLSFGQGLKKV